jgi:hypothetical protein
MKRSMIVRAVHVERIWVARTAYKIFIARNKGIISFWRFLCRYEIIMAKYLEHISENIDWKLSLRFKVILEIPIKIISFWDMSQCNMINIQEYF